MGRCYSTEHGRPASLWVFRKTPSQHHNTLKRFNYIRRGIKKIKLFFFRVYPKFPYQKKNWGCFGLGWNFENGPNFENWGIFYENIFFKWGFFWKLGILLKVGQFFENRAFFWKWGTFLKIGHFLKMRHFLKMGQFFENGAFFWKWGIFLKIGQILKMGHFFQKNGANFENGAKIKNLKCASNAREIRVKCAWILCRNPRVIYKWRARVKCAWNAR